MSDPEPDAFAELLRDYEHGVPGAESKLADAVYADLRRMAERRMTKRYGPRGVRAVTLQPTALASDTLMKLLKQRKQPNDREHFFALAARQMWRLLEDYQRKRDRRVKAVTVDLGTLLDHKGDMSPDFEAQREAVARLKAVNARHAEVVERRLLFGQSIEDVVEATGWSHATVERYKSRALLWLAHDLAARGSMDQAQGGG